MQKLVHSHNYLTRYLLFYVVGILLYCFYPPGFAWPLRLSWCFLPFALLLLLHPIGALRCGHIALTVPQTLKRFHTIWLWQGLALCVSVMLYLNIRQLFNFSALAQPWPPSPFLAHEFGNKLLVMATCTTILAFVVMRHERPLTITPLFKTGANALTRLIIFGNTWLRDASVMVGMISLTSSTLLLTRLLGWQNPPLLLECCLVLSFIGSKSARGRRLLRRLCQQHGFAWVLFLLLGVFLSALALSQWLAQPLLAYLPRSPSFFHQTLNPTNATILMESLSMLVITPLLFRVVPYCRGLSLKTAILGQFLNPYFIALGLSQLWHPWLNEALIMLGHSKLALAAMSIGLFCGSLCYLGSAWFARLVEQLFTNEQWHYPSRLRQFFNQRLQVHFLLWLLIFGLGLSPIAMILITSVAAGTLLAYFHFYFLLWRRVNDSDIIAPPPQHSTTHTE